MHKHRINKNECHRRGQLRDSADSFRLGQRSELCKADSQKQVVQSFRTYRHQDNYEESPRGIADSQEGARSSRGEHGRDLAAGAGASASAIY